MENKREKKSQEGQEDLGLIGWWHSLNGCKSKECFLFPQQFKKYMKIG